MADNLYLSLWFPSFDVEDMLPRSAAVLRQFPYSATEPGVSYISVQPLDWTQPSVLERRIVPPAPPEEAVTILQNLVNEDYAIEFEAYWDLWTPAENGAWVQKSSKVIFIAHGLAFDEGAYEEHGHIEVDFGLDHNFLHEELDMTKENEEKVKANVAKLVEFTQRIEKNCKITGRVLWNESDENLAQKLMSRLQQIQ